MWGSWLDPMSSCMLYVLSGFRSPMWWLVLVPLLALCLLVYLGCDLVPHNYQIARNLKTGSCRQDTRLNWDVGLSKFVSTLKKSKLCVGVDLWSIIVK